MVRSKAEFKSFLLIPNSSIFGLSSEKLKQHDVNSPLAIDSVLESIDSCAWKGF